MDSQRNNVLRGQQDGLNLLESKSFLYPRISCVDKDVNIKDLNKKFCYKI